ncbi:MAG TPA: leucyl aminopeptidase, partial [Candidatus Acidoferrales bacterium]|nr:leucyl aminopeptidase [Candidatus Acidoferrales bacterium]
MKITLSVHAAHEIQTDALIVPATREWKAGEVADLDRRLKGALITEINQQGFKGSEGDVALFQTQGKLPARYVVIVGVGKGTTNTAWYKLAHCIVTSAQQLRATSAALVLPSAFRTTQVVERISEGLHLSSYSFEQLKSSKDHKPRLSATTMLSPTGNGMRTALKNGTRMAAATCYARDLTNLPAATVTPTYLADEAERLARDQDLRVRIFDQDGIKRAGMGALLGVAQGSVQPPRFIELIYKPKSKAPKVVAICGKGITFDSGGLSIKTAEGMQSQKRDMAGGGVVLGVMSALRDLNVAVEVRGYVAAAENMPDGRAIKPGDVLRAYNGKTIEVLNTDAEGRLVLADALSFAAAAEPDVLIDLATLTAAVRSALGTRYAAIMGTEPSLVQGLIGAARDCDENLWELPLVDEYRSDITSSIADIKNTGEGTAGTIIGGLFLREFIGKIPWAHIDFSSTVIAEKPQVSHPR